MWRSRLLKLVIITVLSLHWAPSSEGSCLQYLSQHQPFKNLHVGDLRDAKFLIQLKQFTLDAIDWDQIEALSPYTGVLYLPLKDQSSSRGFVLRLDTSLEGSKVESTAISNTLFERFANHLIRALGDRVYSPPVLNVSKEQLEEIFNHLPLNLASRYRQFPEYYSMKRASLTVYLPIQNLGKTYATDIHRIRALLSQMTQRDLPFSHEDQETYNTLFRKAWDGMDNRQQMTFREDLNSAFPELRDTEISQVFTDFIQNPHVLHTFKGDRLLYAPFERMNVELLQAASEYWTLFQILQIQDSHRGNLLWEPDQSAIIVDPASVYKTFLDGSSEMKWWGGVTPFGLYTEPSLVDAMLGSLSPKFLENLKTVDPEKIQNWAEEVGMEITDQQTKGIMGRIQQILNQRDP